MRYYDVIMTTDIRCARALRHYMRERGESGLVVFPKEGRLHVAADEYSTYAVDFSCLVEPLSYEEINLTEQNIAWPSDVLNLGKLPNGYVVWQDGGRFKKVGGIWCRLQNRYYVCIDEVNARRFLPKAWFR